MSDTGPLFVSSGDLIADRRYKWGLDQAAAGDFAAAADILTQTVEIAPGFATAWFALGAIRDRLGDRAGAVTAFEKARDADPDDYHGARLQLARLGSGETTPAMNASYVRRLFDQYAARFDVALTERLAYRGPAALREAVEQALHTARRPLRFDAMLDLGCGTGLAGAAFAPLADRLVGVDLSPAMIAQAEKKQLYDRLAAGDLAPFLADELSDGARYDLVVAADVFVYVNDLAPVLAAITRNPDPERSSGVHGRDPRGRGRDPAADAALRPQRCLRPSRAYDGRPGDGLARQGRRPQRKGRAGRQPRGDCLDSTAGRHYFLAMTVLDRPAVLPDAFLRWFAGRGWTPRAHQLDLLAKTQAGRSVLLIAPTGGGKTLAGFLPSLVELSGKAIETCVRCRKSAAPKTTFDRPRPAPRWRTAYALHLAAESACGRHRPQS